MSGTSGFRRSAPTPSAARTRVHPIVDLQIEYSLISRGIEDDILPTCRELGIGITAYGVLSRGLISGHWSKDRSGDAGFSPRRARASRAAISMQIWRLVEPLRAIAGEIGATAGAGRDRLGRGAGHTTSCRWSARGGATGSTEALGALDVKLTPAHLAALASAFPPDAAAGARYRRRSRWRISTARSVEIEAGEH